MEPTNKIQEEESVIRHCAYSYCLKLCGLPTKLCGGCKKRAYCSRECQAKDWSIKGDGQRHKNWCRLHDECGEEDVDWEVVPIPNKGLGIRAKKLLPAGMKIILEPVIASNDCPGIRDLGPEGGAYDKKLITNNYFGFGANFNWTQSPYIISSTVAIRIARVNHACSPNASTIFDEPAHVAILFAQKDIQPGEEITICYYPKMFSLMPDDRMPDTNPKWNIDKEFSFAKNELKSTHGITCPDDCSCNDPAIRALVVEGRQLQATRMNLCCQKTEESLAIGEKLLDIHRRLNSSWWFSGNMLLNLFLVAVERSETLPRAMDYIRSATELFRKISPYSVLAKECEKLLEHPETDPNYTMLDNVVSELARKRKIRDWRTRVGVTVKISTSPQ